jgi:type IV secretory pathway component VirB8
MQDEKEADKALVERIESGEYYKQARLWYDQVYIAPISQRILFIVVALFAASFMFMAFVSVTNLLPISPHVPFVIHNDKPLELHPKMRRFKKPSEPADPALIRYYLETYIKQREGYNARRMLMSRAFVLQHSVPKVAQTYLQNISKSNPKSPVRLHGRFRDVLTDIRAIRFLPATDDKGARRVEIDFSTIVMANQQQQKTDWTATLAFEYTNLTMRNTYDESVADYVLDFDEPTFKVTEYTVRERLSRSR